MFPRSLEFTNVILAMCLTRYHPPKYFDEARSLFDMVLKVNNSSTSALVGKGQLLGEQEDYPAALKLLETALAQKPDDLTIKLEVAWYRALCKNYEEGLDSLESCLPLIQGTDMRTRNLKARTLYRIGVCLWNIDPSPAARKRRTGAYARFLGALQADANYAPAYTSLGLYYADYGRDKKRARKCFLKAIELSASEVVAAERLARSYADEGDWDLVELVAQRVVDAGKTRPDPGSKRQGVSWPLAALGVVQLNKQDYAKSIVSFQHALRISPKDYHSWIGLGESYHNSGRYIAATKAFEQAQNVHAESGGKEVEESWLAKFLSANVKRELGQHEEAIQGYKDVLQRRPGELGVVMALVQTLVDAAWQSIQGGFFGGASDYAQEVFHQCSQLYKEQFASGNVWKTVADACLISSYVHKHVDDFPSSAVHQLLGINDDRIGDQILSNVDGVRRESSSDAVDGDTNMTSVKECLHAALLAQKRSLQSSANEVHARAVAWFNLGWAEYRAHVCLSLEGSKATSTQSTGYLRASMYCFRRAIESEARNADFWDALGVAASTARPEIAQHAFVRSLYLNDKVGVPPLLPIGVWLTLVTRTPEYGPTMGPCVC